jgi:hypothetical protein
MVRNGLQLRVRFGFGVRFITLDL